jgi:hypothetical protein
MGNPSAVTALVGAAVSIQFTANGGVPPYTYTSSAGLPAGLSLNSQTGLVSGTVATAGTYPLTIQVTDSSNRAVSATGTITVATPLTMANPAAVTGSVGATVSIQFTAVGGTQPYTYSVQAGSLPTGLTLNPQTGLVTGIATQTGGFTFLVQVTDSSSQILTATATGSITTTVLTVTGTISLVSSTGVAYTPGGAVPAGTQPTVTVTLGTPPPEAVTGTLSVAYFRSLDGLESREVAFSIVSPKFTVASGSTQAVFTGGPVALIVGTAAGQGEVAVAFQDALGNNIASPTVQPFTFSVAGTAPVITSFAISAPSNNSYTVTVIGYSSTLDMSNAVFNLVPTSGTNLASSSVTVSLSSAFTLWYGSSQSNQFGGQFMLTVPLNFSVSGGVSSNPIDAATVTLTNSKGSTTSNSANP